MKYKNFENKISETFLQDSAAVDTDALIASLGIPVAVEHDRKITWWMLAGLVALSLLLVGLYHYISLPSHGGLADNAKSSIEVSSKDIKPNNNLTSVAIVASTEEKENERANAIEVVSGTEVNQNAVIKNISKEDASLLINPIGETKNIISANETSIIEEDNFTPSTYTTTAVGQSRSYADVEVTEMKSVDELSNKSSSRLLDPIFSLDGLTTELLSEKDYPGLPDPECPSFSYRIPWNIALLAEVGVMNPMKELESNGAAANGAFALREMNENSKEAIQIGLHAKVSKGNNPLYVRGGIAYTRIAEQMNEQYDFTEQDTMRGLISITTSMTGDTITSIYGDVISETRFTGRTVKHYYLHLWDLPIAVGYELPVGGSFYVGGEVGVQINLKTSGSGFIFRDVNDYADLSEVTTKETKVGLSYFGGLHFGKHLSKRSSIQLSARFRYYPSQFSTIDPTIEQKYNLAGIHAGYVWRF